MPVFDTPQPITVTLEFDVATARISAGKRADTVVEVLPGNSADEADVRAAEQTDVTYANGKLTVKGPRKRSLFGKPGSLRVSIELPAGSEVHGTSPLADFICEGPLGDCRLKTSAGDIQVGEAGAVVLRTGLGDIRLARARGDAEITGAGRVDIGELGGTATVKNGNGETRIGEVAGDLRAHASNGRISVGVARAGVDARSANGGIRIGEVTRGKVTVQTSAGDLDIGVPESTAAWLDVNTRFGTVHSELTPADGPGDSRETVEVRARTAFGDITVRRP
ncbi:DUF4097 family beta strand repeat-containing protein [Streptomyces cinnamoneus]|uniref:DUF4097 domain-containing protein n=1 Tax=Streptomyces cinnamoneus TaxID=53446 RepID=A0A918TIH1_STRCJ|nr:DUF4097 family beta strand repeat-containing protein [Streptomyces cinnamoneus]GHC43679.1 hypothetical protein GCM10010507_18120 [Streptomyces cinnamoneus]